MGSDIEQNHTTDLSNQSLTDLASGINAEHRACSEAMQKVLQHALDAGTMLLEAKSRVKHGQWLPWLEQNCSIPERTAQLYMRLARHRDELEKNATVADLTLRGAEEEVRGIEDLERLRGTAGVIEAAQEAGRISHEQAVELKEELARKLKAVKEEKAHPTTTLHEIQGGLSAAYREKRDSEEDPAFAREREAEEKRRELWRTGKAFLGQLSRFRRHYPDLLITADAIVLTGIIQDLMAELMEASEAGMPAPKEVHVDPEDARCEVMRLKTDEVQEHGRDYVKGLAEVLEEFPELADGVFAWGVGAHLKQVNEIIQGAINPELPEWDEPHDVEFEILA